MADDELVQIQLRLKDARKFIGDAKLSERAVKGIGDETERADRRGRIAAVGFGMFTKSVDLLKVAVFGAATVLGTLATLGIGKAVMASSNLTEALNKTRVVFDDNAAGVVAWSKTTALGFGISQRAALDAAGVFGNMLVPMGVLPKDAATMSMALTELGGDMASFNNASPQEVLDALRSGLSGETEPLRKFGVFLSAANIEAKAAAMGLKKVGGEFTQASKTTAAYNLILEQTKLQQGDVARSAKTSLAVSWSKFKAVLEDVAASLGTRFLPYAIRVVQVATDMLATFDRARKSGASFGFAIATAFDGAAGGGTRFRDLFVKVKGIIATVVGFIRGTVVPALTEFGASILKGIAPALPFLENIVLPLLKGIGIIGALVGAWKVVWPVLKLLFKALGWVGTAAKPLKGAIEGVGKVIGFLLAGPILKGVGLLGKFGGMFGSIGKVAGFIGGALVKFGAIYMRVFTFFPKLVLKALGAVIGIGMRLFGRFAPIAAIGLQALFQTVRSMFGKVLGFITGLGKKFGDTGKKLWGHLVDGLKSAIGAGAGFVKDIGGGLVKFIARIIDDALPNKLGSGRFSINLPNNPIQDNLPALAMGGVLTSPGSVIVGDGGNGSGAEVLDLPRGARVRPLSRDERSVHRVAGGAVAGGGRALRIEVPVYIDGKHVGDAVADVTADELARR